MRIKIKLQHEVRDPAFGLENVGNLKRSHLHVLLTSKAKRWTHPGSVLRYLNCWQKDSYLQAEKHTGYQKTCVFFRSLVRFDSGKRESSWALSDGKKGLEKYLRATSVEPYRPIRSHLCTRILVTCQSKTTALCMRWHNSKHFFFTGYWKRRRERR